MENKKVDVNELIEAVNDIIEDFDYNMKNYNKNEVTTASINRAKRALNIQFKVNK